MPRVRMLARFRKGWENENLAKYILSRFCFVAQPSSVSDDLGSDFFCTLFERIDKGPQVYLVPRSSFAIQVKSNHEPIDASNKIPYLCNLEIPFFVGVCHDNTLEIYSGEYIPFMFSQKGDATALKIKLCRRDRDSYYEDTGGGRWEIYFPMVTTISVSDSLAEMAEATSLLTGLCSRMQYNISTKTVGEYVLRLHGEHLVQVFAGRHSAQVFRDNFYWRLSEAFHNLQWLHNYDPARFSESEFRMYEAIVGYMVSQYGTEKVLQPILAKPMEYLRERLDSPSQSSAAGPDICVLA